MAKIKENTQEEKPALYSAKEAEKILQLNNFQIIRLEHFISSKKISEEMTLSEWENIVRSL